MKKILMIILILSFSLLFISCKKDKEKIDVKSDNSENTNNENTVIDHDTEPNDNDEPTTPPKPFIDGKKLVVFGDSITAIGTWGKSVAEELNMYFYNAAMGGITSRQGLDRFEVFVKNSGADFVTILFGHNDLIMNTYNTPKVSLEEFEENLEELVKRTREIGATPILLTTNPLNPDIFWTAQGQDPKNYEEVGGDPLAWLDQYNEVTRKVAKDTECDLVDMRKGFSEKYYRNTLSDGIHLNARGNEIFKDLLIEYFLGKFDKDPNAEKVKEEDLTITVTSTEHVSLISFDPTRWYTLEPDNIKMENVDDALKLYNTNGLWPDVQYNIPNPILIDYDKGVIHYEIEVRNVDTSIILFFNGSTASAYQNGEYVVLNSKISASVNAAGDVVGPGVFTGDILIKDLGIAKTYIKDGMLLLSGIKVFVAGTKGQAVIIKELSVSLSE